MAADQTLDAWAERLGPNLLGFLLNADGGPTEPLTAAQRQTLAWLGANGESLQKADPRPSIALCLVKDAAGLPMAWRFRQENGGVVPQPPGSAATSVRLLGLIARDLYCALLGKPDDELSPADVARMIESHPKGAELAHLLADEKASWGDLVLVEGIGATALAAVFGSNSLLAAANRRLKHGAQSDAAAFMRHAMECLEDVRELIANDAVEIPVVIGLNGLALEGQEELELPCGTLRRPTSGEENDPSLDVDAHTVLETQVTGSLLRDKDLASAGVSHDNQDRLTEIGRAICLASVLSQREDNAVDAPMIAWITDLPPVHAVAISFRPLMPILPRRDIDTRSGNDLDELASWTERVLSADLSRIDIAIERLLRACWERHEPSDALIDAVIAWENLVGTQHETTFRVTAALAVLCEDRVDRRIDTRRELAAIYDARSRLVHGDTMELTKSELSERAIRVCCDAIRRLIVDSPQLLGLRRSDDRANRLLLGVDG